MPDEWEIEFYANENGFEPCRAWMDKLAAQKRIALEEAIESVLGQHGLAVVGIEWAKSLGQGLYEFRLRWTAAEHVARQVACPMTQKALAEYRAPAGADPQAVAASALLSVVVDGGMQLRSA
jgi:hypothetical protein